MNVAYFFHLRGAKSLHLRVPPVVVINCGMYPVDVHVRTIIRYFHIISRNVLPHIQISAVKIVTGLYEG